MAGETRALAANGPWGGPGWLAPLRLGPFVLGAAVAINLALAATGRLPAGRDLTLTVMAEVSLAEALFYYLGLVLIRSRRSAGGLRPAAEQLAGAAIQ